MGMHAEFKLEEIDHFIGTLRWYRHALDRDILFTEGVQFLAERAGAYWLLGVMVMVVAPPGVVVTLVAVCTGAVLVMVVAAAGVVDMVLAAGAVPMVMPLFGSTAAFEVLTTLLAMAGAAVVVLAAVLAVGLAAGAVALLTLCPVP